MRLNPRKWRWLGLAAILLVAATFAVRTWVVPAILVREIQAHYRGKVVVRDWWLNWNSSGIRGVELGETPAEDSPTWLKADRITTDVSLSSLLRGRFLPGRVEVDRPVVHFRIDAKGQPLTKFPIVPDKADGRAQPKPGPLPELVMKDGEITLAQEGRKPMTMHGVSGSLAPVPDGSKLDVKTDDPTWGQAAITGHFDPTFKDGDFQIQSSPGFVADPEKLDRIPFVPAEVWANLEPRGPVDAKVNIKLAADTPKPVTVHTELTLKGTAARLNSLQVQSTDTTGHVVIDDALVKVEDLLGKTLDGTISASGTLDFGQKVPKIDLALQLKGIDVTKAPASWQLGEVGATGRMSGRVDLKVALAPSGPDLTGSSGRAVIEDGSFQGIPIKSLNLGLRADGNDLQYETLPEGSVDKNKLDTPTRPQLLSKAAPAPKPNPAGPGRIEFTEPVVAALPLLDLASHEQGLIGWVAYLAKEAVSFQVRHAEQGQTGGLRLPRTISTRIVLEDVDLTTIVEKAKKFGITLPFPVAGRFSITADATIPIGSLRDIRAYGFKGDATLRGASIDHVDLGLVTTHVDLADGVLDLSDFRGQFVDRPTGNVLSPPKPTPNVPSVGPLPPGAFRGQLHASISPLGPAKVRLEGDRLPLGEIFAPFLPIPTPISGEASLRVEADGNLAKVDDPNAWSLRGAIDSRRIKYLQAVLDQIAAKVVVHDGRVEVSDGAALLLGRPLHARAVVEIAAPHRFNGGITIEGWEIAEVLKFVPSVPSPPPASGSLDAKGEASGTLQPFDITTHGAARVLHAKAGPAPVGNLGFQWKTDQDAISITGLELFAFGGRTTGQARIPIRPGQMLQASAELKGIDAAKLSAALQAKGMALTGKADGRLDLSMPMDASVIHGELNLNAPDLTVKHGESDGIAVKSLLVKAVARDKLARFEATAEGLGGKLRFQGTCPIEADPSKSVAEGEILTVGFRLAEVFKGLGITGGLSHLQGVGAFDANIRAPLKPFQLAGRGQFELRDLRYGTTPPLGNLKGIASLGPTGWRVDDLKGDLMGGLASGDVRGDTSSDGSKLIAFDMRVDRASLARITKVFPSLAHDLEGFGSLRVSGRVADALQASAEILVPRARVMNIPVSDLRLPAEIEMNPATGSGSIHSRHWTARVAGGSARGSAWNRFGQDKSFQAEVQLNGVELEVLSKIHPTGKRPPTGKVSGKITLQGPDPAQVGKIRGRVDLDLDDASLVELPLFKELDKFLGSSGGGLFEDGDVHGTIFNRTLFVEQMTLKGRLVQIHATGSITFGGGLNLEVLINTNSMISQPELALLGVVPGLGQALGRGEEALQRVTAVLENSLLKLRVSGTTSNPHVQLDAGVSVGGAAVGFFSTLIKAPGR